jgi:hypothetical protein
MRVFFVPPTVSRKTSAIISILLRCEGVNFSATSTKKSPPSKDFNSIFFIDISSYLNFHKNDCNGLEEKENSSKMILKRGNGKLFPSFPCFPPLWANDFTKKAFI